MKRQEDTRQLKLNFRVRLEPVLEPTTYGLTPDEIDEQARAHYRWSKQLWLKATVMRRDGILVAPSPAPPLPPCPQPEWN